MLKIQNTTIEAVKLIQPDSFEDRRGYFMETYHKNRYAEAGINHNFIQDNMSFSYRLTLRGLHFQYPRMQAKLVQAIQGEIFDVAVDIRRGSPTFGKWVGVRLSDQNRHQLYIPEGFAHGFCVLSQSAVVAYKCSDLYAPSDENGVLWSDPDIGIDWPAQKPVLSTKDSRYGFLNQLPTDALPAYGHKP